MKNFKLIIFLLFIVEISAQGIIENSSGDLELDEIRKEITSNITQRKTFKLRAIKMKLWAAMLQQQGIPLKEYIAIDNRLNKVTRWNNLWSGNKPQQFSDKQMQKV